MKGKNSYNTIKNEQDQCLMLGQRPKRKNAFKMSFKNRQRGCQAAMDKTKM